jgi:hypothetical protein
MTEQTWLKCCDPKEMLEFLHDRADHRKIRLFACACCRRIWHLFADERSRRAVEVAERFIDGEVGLEEREAAVESANAAQSGLRGKKARQREVWVPLRVAAHTIICAGMTPERFQPNACLYAAEDIAFHIRSLAGGEEAALQAELLRDLLGPLPFRPISLDPLCRTPGVLALAQSMYDDRSSGDYPILADALEEAGCSSPDVLRHLREPGPHVRGCWVLDLVLQK